MKKFLSIITISLLVLGLVACGSKGDGKGGNDKKATVETQKIGNIEVYVPEGMTATKGDLIDKENPDSVMISDEAELLKYVIVSKKDEENIDMGIEWTKELNTDAEFKDEKLSLANGDFQGLSYDSNGSLCVELKGKMKDGGFVQITSANFNLDDETYLQILESVK